MKRVATVHCHGLAATRTLASRWGAAAFRDSSVRRPLWIGLSGGLGAGKTTFVRAFVEAWCEAAGRACDEVSSPTFALVHAYDDGRLLHADLYRLSGIGDTETTGLWDHGPVVALIEWPERDPAVHARLDLVIEMSRGAADAPRDRVWRVRSASARGTRFWMALRRSRAVKRADG
jgi:tRNA threonylcarbamoyl adenosine modification protein YjeE